MPESQHGTVVFHKFVKYSQPLETIMQISEDRVIWAQKKPRENPGAEILSVPRYQYPNSAQVVALLTSAIMAS